MLTTNEVQVPGFEKILEIKEPTSGLHGFIALHDTRLGPGLGGVRMYPYPTAKDALDDVLRLARGMTYKSALVEIGMGGGKAVIIGNPQTQKTPELLHQFGNAVNLFNGQYIAAEDVGTTPEDMVEIKKATPFVAALPTKTSSGDPSRFTAWGIYRGMQAIAVSKWDDTSLRYKKIVIQGLGNVGQKLANRLFWEGAELYLTDIDPTKLKDICREYGATAVSPDEIYSVPCDIFAPCALGGILNEQTIPKLQCMAIAGAANNQLKTEADGDRLLKRGILYAPDFVINAGGIINAAAEFEPGGYSPTVSREKVTKIFDTLLVIFARSQHEKIPTSDIANALAEYKLKALVGRREEKIVF